MRFLTPCLIFISLFTISPKGLFAESKQVYPAVEQIIVSTSCYPGDKHGNFKDDPVVHLSDGSEWKVHPKNSSIYSKWRVGERVHVKVRLDHYCRKREHKFLLCNDDRNEEVKVRLTSHKSTPELKIVYTDIYAEDICQSSNSHTKTVILADGTIDYIVVTGPSHTSLCDYYKALYLSDGSVWIIQKNFNAFKRDMPVYIGMQGDPEREYDYVLIGSNSKGGWVWARPR